MNAIEKFAKEHGAEYEDEKTLAPLFKKAVQSVIGKKGKVRQAWTYTGSNEYGYVDWEASVVGVDGMMPEDEIVIVLTTDLDDGNSWVCGRYMDENDTIAEVDDTPTDDPFDAVSVIDKLMSEVREERSSKGESKKNERGSTQIETYDGFDELLGYADAEYLLEDVVDVLSQYYTYEDETFDEDQAKDDPEFTIKIEGGDERADFYSEDIFYVHLPNKEAAEELAKVLGGELNESKKPESRKKSEGVYSSALERIDAACKKRGLYTEWDNDKKIIITWGKGNFLVEERVYVTDTSDGSGAVSLNLYAPSGKPGMTINANGLSVEDVLSFIEDPRAWRNLDSSKKWIVEDGKKSVEKKSEGIGDRIKMGIDYNMFMRMCRTAAYLDEDEDYWDALWEYYSEMGEISDALEFFDNLFQYTAWCDADELYDEYLDDKFKDKSKSKEECIEKAIDEGVLDGVYPYGDHYLMVY